MKTITTSFRIIYFINTNHTYLLYSALNYTLGDINYPPLVLFECARISCLILSVLMFANEP